MVDALFRSDFDPLRRRLHLRYAGFWTVEEAKAVFLRFRLALQQASDNGRPFTLLDDLREWHPQRQEVVEANKQFALACHGFPIIRNAMIVPSSLMRMQIHRTLDDSLACQVFDIFEAADLWLAEVE